MTEFGAAATLSVTVPDSELRIARQKIEEEIGDVTVEVEASTSGGSGGSGGRMAGKERAMSRQLLTEANRLKESNLDLDEQRNELLEELLDASEDEMHHKARSGGVGMAAAGLGVAAVGAVGSSILSGLNNLEFEPEVPEPDWLPIPLEKPRWVPLPVSDPDGAPGEEPTPTPTPTDDPVVDPGPGGVGIPTGPGFGTDSPAHIPNAPPAMNPLPTQDPSPAPDIGLPDVSAEEIVKVGVGGTLAGGLGKLLSKGKGVGGATAGSSVGFPSPSGLLAGQTQQAQEKDPGDRNVIERALVSALREADIGGQAATFNVDVTNEFALDGVDQQQLQRAMNQAQQDALNRIRREVSSGGRGVI